MKFAAYKVDPVTSYKWSYGNPVSGVYNPSCPCIRPFILVITPFRTSRGPPCRGDYTTQLCRAYSISHYKDFYEPTSISECHEAIRVLIIAEMEKMV